MKIRSSTKITLGFLALGVAGYFGYQWYARTAIDSARFEPIQPGEVTLVGINPGSGFRIIVSNQVAQLVEGGTTELEVADITKADEGEKSRRIPLKELMKSLQGDTAALGTFVTTLNDDLRNADIQPNPVVWKAEDIQKALSGDKQLEKKLIDDLNVNLDGSPVAQISRRAVMYGIVIDSPVPVKVPIDGQLKTLPARVQLPYHPRFTYSVAETVKNEFDLSIEELKGHYIGRAKELIDEPRNREDVRASLEGRIDPAWLRRYAKLPERVLSNAYIVLNEDFMMDAEYSTYENAEGKNLHDIRIELTDEGRRRLWQYSRKRQGSQLLMIVDGVAVAAPLIRSELPQGMVTITQLPDESLVRDTVDQINELRKQANK